MTLKDPVIRDPVQEIRVKESRAAFIEVLGKAVDGQKIVVEGRIKSRIAYIGPDAIIHHYEEDIPFSHLIKNRNLHGHKRSIEIEVLKNASGIEYAHCNFNTQQKIMELTMILNFSLNIKEDGREVDSFEERTLVTTPLAIELPEEKGENQKSMKKNRVKVSSLENLLEKKMSEREKGIRKDLQKDLVEKMKTTSSSRLLNQWKREVKKELGEGVRDEVKKELEKEMQEILPSLKESIVQEILKRESLLEEEKRERIIKKSLEQRKRGYRIKESNLLS